MSETRCAQMPVAMELLHGALALPPNVEIYRLVQTEADVLCKVVRVCLVGEGLPVPERGVLEEMPIITGQWQTEVGERLVFEKWT